MPLMRALCSMSVNERQNGYCKWGSLRQENGGSPPTWLAGWVGECESRFIVWMKRRGFDGGFRCKFRTYVDGGVWCVCETTDFPNADRPHPLAATVFRS